MIKQHKQPTICTYFNQLQIQQPVKTTLNGNSTHCGSEWVLHRFMCSLALLYTFNVKETFCDECVKWELRVLTVRRDLYGSNKLHYLGGLTTVTVIQIEHAGTSVVVLSHFRQVGSIYNLKSTKYIKLYHQQPHRFGSHLRLTIHSCCSQGKVTDSPLLCNTHISTKAQKSPFVLTHGR